MERNGDIATEFSSYYPESFQLSRSSLKGTNTKMCKDDISKSLFCDMSDGMGNDIIMAEDFSSPTKCEAASGLKSPCIEKLASSDKDFINSDAHMLSIIQRKSEDTMNNLLPLWKRTSEICGFPSSQRTEVSQFLSQDSFMNGKKVLTSTKNSFQIGTLSSNSLIASDSSRDATSDSILQNCEDNTSSSSIEEIFCPISANFNEIKRKYQERHESKTTPGKAPLQGKSDLKTALIIPKIEGKETEPSPKNDRRMPELVPTLICLDDDDSLPNMEEKVHEVINVADSPEMPKLIPFSTETEDLIQIKKERLDETELAKPSFQLQSSTKRILLLQEEMGSVSNTRHNKPENVDLRKCTRQLFQEAENSSNAQKTNCTDLSLEVCEASIEKVKLSDKSKSENLPYRTIYTSSDSDSESSDSESSTSSDDKSEADDENSVIYCDNENFKSEGSSQKPFSEIQQLASEEGKCEENESQDSINSIRQPKIVLRRLSRDQCLSLQSSDNLSNQSISCNKFKSENQKDESKTSFMNCKFSDNSDDDGDSYISDSECNEKNSSNGDPEIEEIDGLRFFQFRSKHDMEEFNKKPVELEQDIEMIIPTKTTDITQIKGWRNKYFAPENQFQDFPSDNENEEDKCKATALPLLSPNKSLEDKGALNISHCVNDGESPLLRMDKISGECVNIKIDKKSSPENLFMYPQKSEIKENVTALKHELTEDQNPENSPKTNPMSAFVSKDLEDFLLNSSVLNVPYLQTLNPNVTPISRNASILSIGKLKKKDCELNTLAALKRRNFLNKLKEGLKASSEQDLKAQNSPAPIITLSSSEECSTDDDVPVANLSRVKRRRTSQIHRSIPNKCMKRRKSESSSDQNSQRLVLRLTKESKGSSEGYKVSDISCEKTKSENSSLSSISAPSSSESEEELPAIFKIPPDGSPPIITYTVFMKESEPELLGEFLNNLNMYGTSKDVAMLVQSNQSYFVKGPVLTTNVCSEALDSLTTNQKFLDSKSKPTPKKKLRAWQKYLPKKLSKIQQQKISKVLGPEKIKNICDSTATIKQQKSVIPENIPKTKEKIESSQHITNSKGKLKSELVPPEKTFKKKRRSRSLLDESDILSQAERGKRSIRLPARYLDSAVLAAGTEWVSPVFVGDDKKQTSRRQLLDVLERIAPKETEMVTLSDDTKSDFAVASPPNQPVKKKTDEILRKPFKRARNVANPSKFSKLNHTKEGVKISKDDLKNKNITSMVDMRDNIVSKLYSLPTCACSPCSRTSSYQKNAKKFLCLYDHNNANNFNKMERSSHNCDSFHSKSLFENDISVTELKDKLENSNDDTTARFTSSSSIGSKNFNLFDTGLNSPNAYCSGSQVTSNSPVLTQSITSYGASSILQNSTAEDKNLLVPNEITGKDQAVSLTTAAIQKKFLLMLPPMKKSPTINSTIQSATVPSQSNMTNSQKMVQKPSFDAKSKPPILTRKLIPDNIDPLIYDSPPVDSTLNAHISNSSLVNVQDNNSPPASSSSSLQKPIRSKVHLKAFKVGGRLFVCSSVLQGNESNSNAIAATQQISISSPVAQDQSKQGLIAVQPSTVPSISESSRKQIHPGATATIINNSPQNVKIDSAVALMRGAKAPADHLSYHKKKPSERRRKSPLLKRKFQNDSDVDIDVDTIDREFDPKSELMKNLSTLNDSDISDSECATIFSSTMDNVIITNQKKSLSERKRRLFIKRMFEKLKATSPLFKDAKSCNDILAMANFVVRKCQRKEKALKQIKRILRLHNAQLLRKLVEELHDLKDSVHRNRVKKQVIKALAIDWKNCRPEERSHFLSDLDTQSKKKDSNASEENTTIIPETGKESGDTLVAQMDFEIEGVPSTDVEMTKEPVVKIKTAKQSKNAKEYVNISTSDPSKITSLPTATQEFIELPHVQLRILEAPPVDIEKEMINMETIKESEKPKSNHGKETLTSVQNARRPLQFPSANSDGNTSDDDLLIIDLSGENNATAETEEKEPKSNVTIPPEKAADSAPKPVGKVSPMKKFPGLIPLFAANFLDEKLSLVGIPKSPQRAKSLDETYINTEVNNVVRDTLSENQTKVCDVANDKLLFKKTSVSGLMSLIPDESEDHLGSTSKRDAGKRRSSAPGTPLKSPESQKQHLKNGQSVFSHRHAESSAPDPKLSAIRHGRHRSCNDVRILHGVESLNTNVLDAPKEISDAPEEIVIDDSDEETEATSPNRAPCETARSSSIPETYIEDSITVEDDSQSLDS